MTTKTFITAPFKASFPNVFKPTSVPGTNEEPKYKITMYFDKESPETKQFMKIFDKHMDDEIANMWPDAVPRGLQLCKHDGDSDEQLAKSKNRSEGYWIIKASSKFTPEVIERNGDPCMPKDFYAGVIARSKIVVSAYKTPSKGVSCYFMSFIKWADSTPFAGVATSAKDDFSEFLEDDFSGDDNEFGI